MNSLQALRHFDANIERVLDRLHAQSRRELPSLIVHFLRRSFPKWLRGHRLIDTDDGDMRFLRGKLIALSRDKEEFCYSMCCAIQARHIVEVGTSFGVSTIYLAAAARDGNSAAGRQPRVVSAEIGFRKVGQGPRESGRGRPRADRRTAHRRRARDAGIAGTLRSISC